MRRRYQFALTLLFASVFSASMLFAADDEPDIHTTYDSAQSLYKASCWLHGYIHGYEQGFHMGDVDLQLSKSSRDPQKEDAAKIKMRSEYGDRSAFKNGFKQGLEVGYADAYSGREFRAIQELRKIAQELDSSGQDKKADTAIAEGYRRGLAVGLSDARSGREYSKKVSSEKCPNEGKYCEFYQGGIELGYSDGYWNQRSPQEIRTARK